jgi:hypothetical protein
LQWIVPDDQYIWEVYQVTDNVYRVNFPSKMDLVRVQHFGSHTDPETKISMHFEFWKKQILPAWVIDKVWVRVYDLPSHALDDFLGLWALGELFGKTLDVDMAFTRQHDVLRINIACLDPSLIGAKMDVLIQEDFFKLRFEVEGVPTAMAPEVAMEDVNDQDRDNFDDERKKDDGTSRDSEPKRTKNTSSSNTSGDTPVNMEMNQASLRFGTVDSVSTVSTPKKSWAQLVEEEECSLSAPARLDVSDVFFSLDDDANHTNIVSNDSTMLQVEPLSVSGS